MKSDLVNSLGDTQESSDVAELIRETYFEIGTLRDWPWMWEITSLEGVGDVDNPTKLKIPENVCWVEWIKYNKQNTGATDDAAAVANSNNSVTPGNPAPTALVNEKNYQEVAYLSPREFCDISYKLNSEIAQVTTVFENGVRLLIENDRQPTYWTSFDDEFIIMNAFDQNFESTLQQSNNTIHAKRLPTWQVEDTFVPDLPAHLFPYLLAEAKSVCSVEIRQVANEKAEQKSRRQLVTMQHRAWRENGQQKTPDFGRPVRGGFRTARSRNYNYPYGYNRTR